MYLVNKDYQNLIAFTQCHWKNGYSRFQTKNRNTIISAQTQWK